MNKTIINQAIEIFTKLATAIFLFSSIYIAFFTGTESTVQIKYIWAVLLISFVLTVGRIPFFNDERFSKNALIIWNIIYFIGANFVVLATGFFMNWFSLKSPATILGMELTFIAVSIVVCFSIYISIKHSKQKLNNQLKKIKEI